MMVLFLSETSHGGLSRVQNGVDDHHESRPPRPRLEVRRRFAAQTGCSACAAFPVFEAEGQACPGGNRTRAAIGAAALATTVGWSQGFITTAAHRGRPA